MTAHALVLAWADALAALEWTSDHCPKCRGAGRSYQRIDGGGVTLVQERDCIGCAGTGKARRAA